MIVPALAVTSPLLLKVTSYVTPLQTPALAVKTGAVVLGAFTTTVDAGHVPDAGVTVKVTSVPEAIPFTIFPDKLPALAVITAAFGFVILILYVSELQSLIEKLIAGSLHGSNGGQTAGAVTVTVEIQVPSVAVIVTSTPAVIPVILVPDSVPELTVIFDALLVNETL